MENRLSFYAFLLGSILIISAAVSLPRWSLKKSHATISWDVSGYYMYLPAFIIHKDPAKQNFREEVLKKYSPTPDWQQSYKAENSNFIMKYSIGMAILYLPFFLIGHLMAWVGSYPMDGFSSPYQTSLYLGSIFWALVGIWYFRKNLLQFFDDKVTALTILIIALGTNYFVYASYDAAMPHSYLFSMYSILLYYTIKWYSKPSYKISLLIGIIIGLAALSRPTELIIFLIPLLWGIGNLKDLKTRFDLLGQNFSKLLMMALIIGAIGAIQLIYWKLFAGKWIEYSYQDQSFSWDEPYFNEFLFSYKKGWLLYTPIMVFSLLGFISLYKNYRKVFWAVLTYFLVHLYISASWDIWWYGGGFGQRTMIQVYPFLAFPLAAFVQFILKRNLLKYLCYGIFILLISLNQFQIWQAQHSNVFETESMTKAYYWRIFGKTKIVPEDRFLLDTKHDFKGNKKELQVILENSFENFPDTSQLSTDYSYSGRFSQYVNSQKEFSPGIDIPKDAVFNNKKWISASAWFYSPKISYQSWWMPQFSLRFDNKGEIVKTEVIRPHRVMKNGEWKRISLDVKLPEEFDSIKIYMWNAGGTRPLYMDDLKVEIYND